MRKSLWIMVAVLFAAIGAPHAQADVMTNYTISFSGTGTLPTSGSFTYDSTTPAFSSFIVVWDGLTFNLTSAANSPGIAGPTPPACISGDSGAAASFQLLTNCGGPTTEWQANPLGTFVNFIFLTPETSSACETGHNCIGFSASASSSTLDGAGGTFSVAVTTAPEPRSLALMLLGLGLVFVMRKRISQKLLPTS
jgi:hypothetical protein